MENYYTKEQSPAATTIPKLRLGRLKSGANDKDDDALAGLLEPPKDIMSFGQSSGRQLNETLVNQKALKSVASLGQSHKHPLIDLTGTRDRDFEIGPATSKWPEDEREASKQFHLATNGLKSRNDEEAIRKHSTVKLATTTFGDHQQDLPVGKDAANDEGSQRSRHPIHYPPNGRSNASKPAPVREPSDVVQDFLDKPIYTHQKTKHSVITQHQTQKKADDCLTETEQSTVKKSFAGHQAVVPTSRREEAAGGRKTRRAGVASRQRSPRKLVAADDSALVTPDIRSFAGSPRKHHEDHLRLRKGQTTKAKTGGHQLEDKEEKYNQTVVDYEAAYSPEVLRAEAAHLNQNDQLDETDDGPLFRPGQNEEDMGNVYQSISESATPHYGRQLGVGGSRAGSSLSSRHGTMGPGKSEAARHAAAGNWATKPAAHKEGHQQMICAKLPSRPAGQESRVSLEMTRRSHYDDDIGSDVVAFCHRTTDNLKQQQHQNQMDFKIMYLDMQNWDKIEVRLTQKEFKVLPKDILSYLARGPSEMGQSARERKQKIICVDLSNNQIGSLTAKFFESFTVQRRQELKSLKAAKNLIKSVSDKIQLLNKLQTLKLPNNKLDQLPALPQALQHLNLANNMFTEVPVDRLFQLRDLVTLDLSFNKIAMFDDEPRLVLPKLEELYLQGNKLKSLPFIFRGFVSLKMIGLDWFEYLALPYTKPKVVEDITVINQIVDNEERVRAIQRKSMNFYHFAQGFQSNPMLPYKVDSGQRLQEDGRTALHLAIMHRDVTMVQILLECGADPNLMDCYQNTALILALQQDEEDARGSTAILRTLLNYSSRFNFDAQENQRVLLLAVERLSIETVDLFLKKQARKSQIILKDGLHELRDSKTGRGIVHTLIDQFAKAFQKSAAELALLEATKEVEQLSKCFRNKRGSMMQSETRNAGSTVTESFLENKRGSCNTLMNQVRASVSINNFRPAPEEDEPLVNDIDDDFHTVYEHSRSQSPSGGKILQTSPGKMKQYHEKQKALQYEIYDNMSNLTKCKKILNMLMTSGYGFNFRCNQSYTPFHDAVRHGSADLVRYLLENYALHYQQTIRYPAELLIDINAKGGFGQNTPFHLAASRTKYDVVYQLDKRGAWIFERNRDLKTCFQYVNCNQLMLKIVKKLERKQYMANMVTEAVLKLRAGERLLLMSNTVRINTGEYRLLSDTSQKLKKDWLKGGPMPVILPNVLQGKRPSVFSRAASNFTRGTPSSIYTQRLGVESETPSSRNMSRPPSSQRQNAFKVREATPLRTAMSRPDENNYYVKNERSKPLNKNQLNTNIEFFDFLTEAEMEKHRRTDSFYYNYQSMAKSAATIFSAMNRPPLHKHHDSMSIQLNIQKPPPNPKATSAQTTKPQTKSLHGGFLSEQSNVPPVVKNQHDEEPCTERSDQQGDGMLTRRDSANVLDTERLLRADPNSDRVDAIEPADGQALKSQRRYLADHDSQVGKKKTTQDAQRGLVLEEPSLTASKQTISAADMRNEVVLRSTSDLSVLGVNERQSNLLTQEQLFRNQNHKNIFFIKDQIFDADRLRQMRYNQKALSAVVTEPTQEPEKEAEEVKPESSRRRLEQRDRAAFLLPQNQLEFQNGGQSFTYASRVNQEMKLIAQLRSAFLPNLKSHVTVLCDLIEKLTQLGDSRYLAESVLELASQTLQSLGDHRLSTRDAIKSALQNLQDNSSCPEWLQDEIAEVLAVDTTRRPMITLDHRRAHVATRRPVKHASEAMMTHQDELHDGNPLEGRLGPGAARTRQIETELLAFAKGIPIAQNNANRHLLNAPNLKSQAVTGANLDNSFDLNLAQSTLLGDKTGGNLQSRLHAASEYQSNDMLKQNLKSYTLQTDSQFNASYKNLAHQHKNPLTKEDYVYQILQESLTLKSSLPPHGDTAVYEDRGSGFPGRTITEHGSTMRSNLDVPALRTFQQQTNYSNKHMQGSGNLRQLYFQQMKVHDESQRHHSIDISQIKIGSDMDDLTPEEPCDSEEDSGAVIAKEDTIKLQDMIKSQQKLKRGDPKKYTAGPTSKRGQMSLREYASSATKIKSSRIAKQFEDVTPTLSFHRPEQTSINKKFGRQQISSSAQGVKESSPDMVIEDHINMQSDRIDDDVLEFERQFGTNHHLQVASEFKTGVTKPMLTIKNFEKVSHDQYSQAAILSSGRQATNKALGTVESPLDGRIRRPSSISGMVDRTSQFNEFSDKITPANMISQSKTKQINKMNQNVSSKETKTVGPFQAASDTIFQGIKLQEKNIATPSNFDEFYMQFKSSSGIDNKSGCGTVADIASSNHQSTVPMVKHDQRDSAAAVKAFKISGGGLVTVPQKYMSSTYQVPQPVSRPSIVPEMTGRSSVLSQEQNAVAGPNTSESKPQPKKLKVVQPAKKRLVIKKDAIKFDYAKAHITLVSNTMESSASRNRINSPADRELSNRSSQQLKQRDNNTMSIRNHGTLPFQKTDERKSERAISSQAKSNLSSSVLDIVPPSPLREGLRASVSRGRTKQVAEGGMAKPPITPPQASSSTEPYDARADSQTLSYGGSNLTVDKSNILTQSKTIATLPPQPRGTAQKLTLSLKNLPARHAEESSRQGASSRGRIINSKDASQRSTYRQVFQPTPDSIFFKKRDSANTISSIRSANNQNLDQINEYGAIGGNQRPSGGSATVNLQVQVINSQRHTESSKKKLITKGQNAKSSSNIEKIRSKSLVKDRLTQRPIKKATMTLLNANKSGGTATNNFDSEQRRQKFQMIQKSGSLQKLKEVKQVANGPSPPIAKAVEQEAAKQITGFTDVPIQVSVAMKKSELVSSHPMWPVGKHANNKE